MIGSKPSNNAALVGLVEAVFSSCTDRERRLITERDWQTLDAAQGTVVVRYRDPVELTGHRGRTVTVTALLVVTRGANSGTVLARNGDTFYSAFTKCDANALERLRKAIAE